MTEEPPGEDQPTLSDFGAVPRELIEQPFFWMLLIYKDLNETLILMDRILQWSSAALEKIGADQGEAATISVEIERLGLRFAERVRNMPDLFVEEPR